MLIKRKLKIMIKKNFVEDERVSIRMDGKLLTGTVWKVN